MNTKMLFTSVLTVLIFVVGLTTSVLAQYTTITGRIIDDVTGAPAQGVEVLLENDYQGNTYTLQYQATDANGDYTFTIFTPADFLIPCIRPLISATYSSFGYTSTGQFETIPNRGFCIYVDSRSQNYGGVEVITFRGVH